MLIRVPSQDLRATCEAHGIPVGKSKKKGDLVALVHGRFGGAGATTTNQSLVALESESATGQNSGINRPVYFELPNVSLPLAFAIRLRYRPRPP